ncbi:MAG: hypothetical protein IMY67_00745 [Bacteroidetes bacterium]|nr:hypothetical protein [Bacteroidota bacterium]
MFVFSSSFSVFFFTIILGLAWRHREPHLYPDVILGVIAKSLWLSWLIVNISYYTTFGEYLNFFIILIVVFISINLFLKNYPSCYIFKKRKYISFLAALLVIGLFMLSASYTDYYSLIFQRWDTVVSWNRWATEISENTFHPMNAAYPVFFPGLWSLVYEVQSDNSIWIMAKSIMLIFPIILMVTIYSLLLREKLLSVFLLIIVINIIFFSGNFYYLTSGYMDYPVAAMILVSMILLYLSSVDDDSSNNERANELLLFSIVFASLAAITKQAGILSFVPIVYYMASKYIDKTILVEKLAFYLFVLIFPIIMFLIMFFLEEDNIFGNADVLKKLVVSKTTDSNVYLNAFNIMHQKFPMPLTFSLIAFSMLNIFNLKKITGQLGMLLFIMSAIGFFIFADCCSYDQRNGIWIFSFLVVSVLFGLFEFDNLTKVGLGGCVSIHAKYLVGFILVFSFSVSILFGVNVSEKSIRNLQYNEQIKIGSEGINNLLLRHRDKLGPNGVIVSFYQLTGWLPGMKNKYKLCYGHKDACVLNTLDTLPGSLVLVGKGRRDYPGARKYFTKDKFLGRYGVYELYGPFNEGRG